MSQIYIEQLISMVYQKYCTNKKYKENDRLVLNKENISICEIETISYYFFLNRYKIIYDDYHNEHYYIKPVGI
jgi:hypothetical protein